MKHIGGFFEMELKRGAHFYHSAAVGLSTGRACIRLLLEKLKPAKVYVPYYACDAALDPFNILAVQTEYYGIDTSLYPLQLPELKKDEYFFYTNYFGIRNKEVNRLREKYGAQLIIDDTHGFFRKGYPGNWSFTSARKYFGVPDGAYLYAPVPVPESYERFTEISIAHNLDRFLGKQQEAYREYAAYEKTLNSEIHSISLYSEIVLSHIDYPAVAKKRKENFKFYEEQLGRFNQLPDIKQEEEEVPFCYPFMPSIPLPKELFFPDHIYIPSYWMDTATRNEEGFSFEKGLSTNMLPLMIDHRYDELDLIRVVDTIKKYMNGR